MQRAFIGIFLLLTFTPALPSAPRANRSGKVNLDAIPGYTRRQIQGFNCLLNAEVLANDKDPSWQRKPIDVLDYELRTIARVLPERTVKVLRRLTIWVEWDDQNDPDAGRAVAKYYGVFNNRGLWQLAQNKNPLKANNIEIINMRALTREHQPNVKVDRCVLLHEMVHAVHFQVFGVHNQIIRAAYRQAMDRGLYREAQDVYGRTIRPYAQASEAEYFAELSCAYLNKLHYFPFDRDDLQRHDPVGYAVMVKAWGAPRRLEAAIKADAERAATLKLHRARTLNVVGKTNEARTALNELLNAYPETRAASEARTMLEKLPDAATKPSKPAP